MPSDIATAILDEKNDEVEPKESFENVPSLNLQPMETIPEVESSTTDSEDLFF